MKMKPKEKDFSRRRTVTRISLRSRMSISSPRIQIIMWKRLILTSSNALTSWRTIFPIVISKF
jgi:hypothetical protein